MNSAALPSPLGRRLRIQFLVALFLLMGLGQAMAQFATTRGTAESLVSEVFKGPGIKVRGIKHVGHLDAMAAFSNTLPHPSFKSGVILCTGMAEQASGANENPKTSTAMGGQGDRKLDAIANTRTFDASSLEFEFMADKDSICLRYIFASEEYAEHVGSTFCDPIIITVTGPGLGSGRNLALLPGTSNIPVNINSINITENKRWYIDNNPFTLSGKPNPNRKAELDQNVLNGFQYDGMTRAMEVGLRITPKEVYRMRIVIADAGDGNFDSALLLEAGSFRSVEQRRHEIARDLAHEKRVSDSLARAEFVRDSLDEAATELSLGLGIKSPELDQEEKDSLTPGMATEIAVDEDEDEFETVEEILEEPTLPDNAAKEVEMEELEKDSAANAGDLPSELELPKEYRTVIQFEEDGYFVPEDQEELLKEYGQILKNNPDYALGVYVPSAADDETNSLRYDMVRLEVIKNGAKPNQVFKLGFSMVDGEGPKMPKHRAELLLRTKE